jgi:hypothetical protein
MQPGQRAYRTQRRRTNQVSNFSFQSWWPSLVDQKLFGQPVAAIDLKQALGYAVCASLVLCERKRRPDEYPLLSTDPKRLPVSSKS